MTSLRLPTAVLGFAERGPDWADFVARLPRLAADLFEEWVLTPDGAAMNGHASLVLPATDAEGRRVVLKLGFPDEESEFEALGLHLLGGDGAVRCA